MKQLTAESKFATPNTEVGNRGIKRSGIRMIIWIMPAKPYVFISHVGQSYSQQSGIELKVKRRLAYLEGALVALVKMLALRSHLT